MKSTKTLLKELTEKALASHSESQGPLVRTVCVNSGQVDGREVVIVVAIGISRRETVVDDFAEAVSGAISGHQNAVENLRSVSSGPLPGST